MKTIPKLDFLWKFFILGYFFYASIITIFNIQTEEERGPSNKKRSTNSGECLDNEGNTANNVEKSNNAGTSQCLNLPIPGAKGKLLVLQWDIDNRKQ